MFQRSKIGTWPGYLKELQSWAWRSAGREALRNACDVLEALQLRGAIALRRASVAALVAAGVLASLPAASAEPLLYAYDVPLNLLVIVDPQTGAVSQVGPVGPHAGGIEDLAAIGPRLFAVAGQWQVADYILELNPRTGAVLSSAQVTVNGQPATCSAEALAADSGGNLVISMWQPGSPDPTTSNSLGLVDLDGAVTALVAYATDFDGLTFDPLTQMFIGVDRNPGGPSGDWVKLVQASYPGGELSLIHHFPISADFNCVDDAAVLGGEIITLDACAHRLNRHDRTTGAIVEWVPYDAAYTLCLCAVVEPVVLGDLNCDGSVNFKDINPFVQVLTNPSAWQAAYPGCPLANGDINGDGAVNFKDINPFVACLTTGHCP